MKVCLDLKKKLIFGCFLGVIGSGFISGQIDAAASINVKRYPMDLQNTYELFTNRCSACHDLDSTINSKYVLPSYYKGMVQEMYEKPDSGMTQSEADSIYEFLVYDAYKRRRRDLRDQLKTLPEDKKKEEQETIKGIRDKYEP